jgi:polyprenyl P-hydroxybenzoate/phenylacrylic acid decarboxylase-like protein
MPHKIALLVTGASGMLLPKHLLTHLARLDEVERVHLVVSKGASQVLKHELGEKQTGGEDLLAAAGLSAGERAKIALHRDSELDAPIASGSYRLTGTAIVPCSASTLASLATGAGRTLIHRAGDVALKERWPLVVAFRETPFSLVHIENMRRLALAGATLLPPIPAFYVGGDSLERFVEHWCLRVLDRFGLPADGEPGLRWG